MDVKVKIEDRKGQRHEVSMSSEMASVPAAGDGLILNGVRYEVLKRLLTFAEGAADGAGAPQEFEVLLFVQEQEAPQQAGTRLPKLEAAA